MDIDRAVLCETFSPFASDLIFKVVSKKEVDVIGLMNEHLVSQLVDELAKLPVKALLYR